MDEGFHRRLGKITDKIRLRRGPEALLRIVYCRRGNRAPAFHIGGRKEGRDLPSEGKMICSIHEDKTTAGHCPQMWQFHSPFGELIKIGGKFARSDFGMAQGIACQLRISDFPGTVKPAAFRDGHHGSALLTG
ncbi:hypothetical protein [Rhizobium sp. CSW-27]|uniref:hypothetical protein n=1 Tax=Rhizobium sp. CSW-27 TaxID=2839985 RepID=UPI001C021A60|nr:hypothetical protein [Rhizobium sp. CSW-27]MBT9373341.1 hypothetical protein [Rhizobium sp. CSW-27]